MPAISTMTTASSNRSSQRMPGRLRRWVAIAAASGGVRLLRGVDEVAADLAFELLPDRLHHLAPGGDVVLGELLDLRLAGVGDLLAIVVVELARQLVAVRGGFGHRLGEALAH